MFGVTLASVVIKYIGETEANFKRTFGEAEHSDAILFFDENDALLDERSEISDSHDCYAGGITRRVPICKSFGRLIPFLLAIFSHFVGSPYSDLAISQSVSPLLTV